MRGAHTHDGGPPLPGFEPCASTFGLFHYPLVFILHVSTVYHGKVTYDNLATMHTSIPYTIAGSPSSSSPT